MRMKKMKKKILQVPKLRNQKNKLRNKLKKGQKN